MSTSSLLLPIQGQQRMPCPPLLSYGKAWYATQPAVSPPRRPRDCSIMANLKYHSLPNVERKLCRLWAAARHCLDPITQQVRLHRPNPMSLGESAIHDSKTFYSLQLGAARTSCAPQPTGRFLFFHEARQHGRRAGMPGIRDGYRLQRRGERMNRIHGIK